MMNRKLVIHIKLCLLISLSLILSYIQIPIIPIAPFLTLDVADVPLIYASLLFGRRYGVIVILCKSLFYWLLQGANMIAGIGVISTIISNLILMLVIWQCLKAHKKTAHALWSVPLTLTVVMVIVNWLFLMPAYIQCFHFQLSLPLPLYLAIAVVPFNIVKGVVSTLLVQLIWKKLPLR